MCVYIGGRPAALPKGASSDAEPFRHTEAEWTRPAPVPAPGRISVSLLADRRHAGLLLAALLHDWADEPDVVVLALPRGGVPVAYEVARRLHAPLEVFVVRKLGVPGYEQLALGAVASGGIVVLNQDVVRSCRVEKDTLLEVARQETRELRRRDQAYRGSHHPVDVLGKTAILVDDGLATGATMRVAIRALRQHGPARIVAAVPVAAPGACTAMSEEADEMICAMTPEPFDAVGSWYEDFSPTSDDEVTALLEGWRGERERLISLAATWPG